MFCFVFIGDHVGVFSEFRNNFSPIKKKKLLGICLICCFIIQWNLDNSYSRGLGKTVRIIESTYQLSRVRIIKASSQYELSKVRIIKAASMNYQEY